MEINDKVAIVTGGASGLGLATVERLLAGGARVAVFDLNKEAGAELASRHQDRVIFQPVDVTSEEDATAAVAETVTEFGALHILVNCAGIGVAARTVGRKGPMPLAEFRRVVEINLVGTFNVLRLAGAEMIRNTPDPRTGERGVIVNTASMAAFDGQMGQAAYAASKGGIVGMTLPIARDFSQFGIRVCTIAPGLFETPLLAALSPEMQAKLVEGMEFPKRMGLPVEFASLAAHIVENPYLNAETIRLDGGSRPPPR